MSEQAMTVKQVAARFGVGEHTVLAWIREGELRAVNCGRSVKAKKPRWRITPEALQSFELLRSASPPPPKPTRRRRYQPDEIRYY